MPITTTPSGGPQGEFSTYTPIYAQTLSASAASITFSNIPTTFTDLVLIGTGTNSVATHFNLTFNSDTATNYSYTLLSGTGAGLESARASSASAIRMTYNGGWASADADRGNLIINVQNYSNISTFKTVLYKNNRPSSATEVFVGLWRSTSAITSMTLTNNTGTMSSGTTWTLYGIKAAAPAPKATGGDVITTDGTYWYHAFKNSGIFSLTSANSSLTADILVVAGGGGSYGNFAGGGGAGGLVAFTNQSLTTTNYTVTVGGGGVNDVSTSGSNSQFGSLTAAAGGGYGGFGIGASTGVTGGSGGSGGGGGGVNTSGYTTAGGTASPSGQGNAGGGGRFDRIGGGGGGAGAVGSTASGTTPGSGGIGVNTYSSWASATGTGVSGYFAGGGGGGSASSSVFGSGGTGGGGAGSGTSGGTGTNGTANTGGGAGGGPANGSGAVGGSGIVIVRYPV